MTTLATPGRGGYSPFGNPCFSFIFSWKTRREVKFLVQTAWRTLSLSSATSSCLSVGQRSMSASVAHLSGTRQKARSAKTHSQRGRGKKRLMVNSAVDSAEKNHWRSARLFPLIFTPRRHDCPFAHAVSVGKNRRMRRLETTRLFY